LLFELVALCDAVAAAVVLLLDLLLVLLSPVALLLVSAGAIVSLLAVAAVDAAFDDSGLLSDAVYSSSVLSSIYNQKQ
jgi:hypothetical protein